MKKCFLYIILIFPFTACVENVSTEVTQANYAQTFQDILEESYEKSYKSLAGISLSAASPQLKQNWNGAHGFDSTDKDQELSAKQPYRIASVTKSFVATAILRLHEMDSISIEDPISQHISDAHIEILITGGYNPDAILIKHCLNHTSGLFDYAMAGKNYKDEITQDPSKRWTRTEQLQAAMEWGVKVGEPGERYSYGDTGYILLGEIVAKYSGGSLASGLRQLLKFDDLGMKLTWLETLEPAPGNISDPVHRYTRGYETTTWDPSIDLYGGGGLMSTSEDLVLFMDALFNGKVYDSPETLELMLTKPNYHESYVPEDNERHKDYRYGLWHIKVFNEDVYIHRGLWGTVMLHMPSDNITIAANFTKGWNDRCIKKTILSLMNLSEGE